MAGLVSSAIVAICVSTQGNYNDACNKALDAGTRQIGLRTQVDQAEDNSVRLLDQKARMILTTEEYSALGMAGFAYKTAKDKRLNFNLPNFGVCDRITNEVTRSSYNIQFNWRF
jgi:hypothetical protein